MNIKNRRIGPGEPCYVIAEIGHNHQGDGQLALELVRQAASAGASAVKFQKRNNSTLFCPDYYNKPYDGANSFGATYGAHREFLEPRMEWLKEANELAHSMGVDFIMTAFDLESLKFCQDHLNVDAYKIQSADLSYDGLIRAAAATGKPYFISCGASSLSEIKKSYALCLSLQTPFCIMYTVSAYPTPNDKLNLARIPQLMETLGSNRIGYSCHHIGIEPSVFARVLGCVAVEKHFTLDKLQKGPDHRLSILPDELKELTMCLAMADEMRGNPWSVEDEIEPHQADARYKMGKSPVVTRDVAAGNVLQPHDIAYVSPAKGISPLEMNEYFGKPVKIPVKKGSYLQKDNFV